MVLGLEGSNACLMSGLEADLDGLAAVLGPTFGVVFQVFSRSPYYWP